MALSSPCPGADRAGRPRKFPATGPCDRRALSNDRRAGQRPAARKGGGVTSTVVTKPHGELLNRRSRAGETFWGPGDMYRFLVAG